MNEGAAIGLLVGVATASDPTAPLLMQEWDWTRTFVEAIDKTSDDPVLRDMVVEALEVVLDLPKSTPGEAFKEIGRRRGFNEIRRGVRR